MDEINKRNTESFKQAMERLTHQLEEQQKQINGLLNTISTLSARVNAVELSNNLQKAKAIGSGPSEKL
jgi:vacuolar-type H+-ATPase subunit D/Vma8